MKSEKICSINKFMFKFVKEHINANPTSFVGKASDITANGSSLSIHDGIIAGGENIAKTKNVPQFVLEATLPASASDGYCYTTAVSADGSVIVGFDSNLNAVWWDRATYTMHQLQAGDSDSNVIEVSDDGTIAVGWDDTAACWWSIPSGIQTYFSHTGGSRAYAISGDGKRAFGRDQNGGPLLLPVWWNINSNVETILADLTGHSIIFCCNIDGTFAGGRANNVPVIWDVNGNSINQLDDTYDNAVFNISSDGNIALGNSKTFWNITDSTTAKLFTMPYWNNFYMNDEYQSPMDGSGLMVGATANIGAYWAGMINIGGSWTMLPVPPDGAMGFQAAVNAISRDGGMTIVGEGYDSNSNDRGLIWRRNW